LDSFRPRLSLLFILVLAGCSSFKNVATTTPETSTLGSLRGRVQGGQQPVVGAHVYLFAIGTQGPAGKDVPASAGNASVSLLNSSGSNVTSDGSNYFVTTDASGGFSISGDYTCTSGTQLYLLALGGNPGAGPNSAAGMMEGVGACPSGGSTLSPNAYFWINEITTAATAYALAGFATDATHISASTSVSGSPAAAMAATGVANAMANINNLVNVSTGTALTTTTGGNGIVPQSELNTLGNVLASCINSSGGSQGNCSTLFNAAMSDGSTGTVPTDTVTVAINIAHNSSQNVATLYNLQGSNAPFVPSLSEQPHDFSVSLTFGGGGASSPHSIVIDSGGDVWGASSGPVVNWYSPLGAPLSPTGLATSTTTALNALTIDEDGDIWAQDVKGDYSEFSASGAPLTSTSPNGGNSGSSGLTTDSFGYFWSANASDGTVFRFDPISAVSVANYTVGPASLIASDSAGFTWIAGSGGTLIRLNQTGTTVGSYGSLYTSPSAVVVDTTDAAYVDDSSTGTIDKVSSSGALSSFSDGVGGAPAMAMDGANNIWSAKTLISAHSSTGANLTNAGYSLAAGATTTSIAVDGSGNLWAADTIENGGQAGAHYTEFVGVAVPAMTPLTYVTTHGTLLNAQNLTFGFNGPDLQFPYANQFYSATNSYFQTTGLSYPAGSRYCHAYLSWDIAEQAVGSGPVGTEGSRSWFEDWLSHAQGNCDRALITFKYISGVTAHDTGSYPPVSDYATAVSTFLGTNWTYTGFTGAMDFTAWNEPQNGAGSGDGIASTPLPAEIAADYYLALRQFCVPASCSVAAGDFGSNGSLSTTFIQNCASDANISNCTNPSYMDSYKYYIMTDAPAYSLPAGFTPEVFAYHGWDDINNYINSSSHCTSPTACTIRALVTSLTDGGWTKAIIWDSEVAAGQNPQSNPDATVQACAASYLLDLTASVSNRITRIYYTQPYTTAGTYYSLFTSDGTPKPAFYVLVDRNIAYQPPAGSTCP
jgi:hypothetical protein